ncbi:hypothetical protein CDAR_478921 [Caerostris darwini]|uniref:Uncharacterized protein n=1 Tax=Caerostris darwini TaxID=1538125 RepID=A0AAV4RU56_9ARAC|nr:hypothetical protein CDAR_478921 [Caerostris darwini]
MHQFLLELKIQKKDFKNVMTFIIVRDIAKGADVVLLWKAKNNLRPVCLRCEGCGHKSLTQRPETAQAARAQGGPHVRENPGRQRPTPELLWGSSCFGTQTTLKAVEDQELGRRRPLVRVLLL